MSSAYRVYALSDGRVASVSPDKTISIWSLSCKTIHTDLNIQCNLSEWKCDAILKGHNGVKNIINNHE